MDSEAPNGYCLCVCGCNLYPRQLPSVKCFSCKRGVHDVAIGSTWEHPTAGEVPWGLDHPPGFRDRRDWASFSQRTPEFRQQCYTDWALLRGYPDETRDSYAQQCEAAIVAQKDRIA